MARKEYEMRVRPQKVVVLVPERARKKQIILAVNFLSRIWGGFYCPIIPVNRKKAKLASFWLKMFPADVVYGIDINHDEWSKACQRNCWSRAYKRLEESALDEMWSFDPSGLVYSTICIKKFLEDYPALTEANIKLIDVPERSPTHFLGAATFGIHHPKGTEALAKALKGTVQHLEARYGFSKFVSVCENMSSTLSWIDFLSKGLNIINHGGSFVFPPTIVLFNRPIDVALFWNLRMLAGSGSSRVFILVPVSEIDSKDSMATLKKWILSSRISSNWCNITSLAAENTTLQRLARKLRGLLKGTRYKHCDIQMPQTLLSAFSVYESSSCHNVDLSSGVLTLLPPAASVSSKLGRSQKWCVDLVKDVETGRLPEDISLPMRKEIVETLNAPAPFARGPWGGVPRVAFAQDCLSIRCNNDPKSIIWPIPNASEIMDSLLCEQEMKPVYDEKRACYEPVFEMFGSIRKTASAFSGDSGKILGVLSGKEAMSLDEIKGSARLGRDQWSKSDRYANMTQHLSSNHRRVFQARWKEYKRKEGLKIESALDLLESWVSRKAVNKMWRLPKCENCGQLGYASDIELNKPPACSGCSQVLQMPNKIPIAYKLSPVLKRAVDEGIVPVALTGRFLLNASKEGFVWVPGLKVLWEKEQYDIDILACCDGELFACECKNLSGIQASTSGDAGVWRKIEKQLGKLIKISTALRVENIVFSCLSAQVPRDLVIRIEKKMPSRMSLIILSKSDLQTGKRMRSLGKDENIVSSSISDLKPTKKRLRPRKRKGKRVISF